MPGHFTFFTTNIHSKFAHFDEAEHRHAIVSLRFKLGDDLVFTDGKNCTYWGKISAIEKKNFIVEIYRTEKTEIQPGIVVVCGIIKSTDRTEWLVEKCTEMGIKKIYFVQTNKSDRSHININKLNRTAVAALKQCHGDYLPEIDEIKWTDALQLIGEKKYIARIGAADAVHISQIPVPTEMDQVYMVGPEGDFSPKELEDAQLAGFMPLDLGKRILRTETAVIAIAANQL